MYRLKHFLDTSTLTTAYSIQKRIWGLWFDVRFFNGTPYTFINKETAYRHFERLVWKQACIIAHQLRIKKLKKLHKTTYSKFP